MSKDEAVARLQRYWTNGSWAGISVSAEIVASLADGG